VKALELRERGELGVEARVQRGVGHGPLAKRGAVWDDDETDLFPVDSAARRASGIRDAISYSSVPRRPPAASNWPGPAQDLCHACLSWRTRHALECPLESNSTQEPKNAMNSMGTDDPFDLLEGKETM
jgi:hypothetical protein